MVQIENVRALMAADRWMDANVLAIEIANAVDTPNVIRVQVLLLAAQCAARLDRHGEAKEAIARATQIARFCPNDSKSLQRAIIGEGKAALYRKDYETAETCFNEHLRIYTTDALLAPYSVFSLGQVAACRNQWITAAAEYERAASMSEERAKESWKPAESKQFEALRWQALQSAAWVLIMDATMLPDATPVDAAGTVYLDRLQRAQNHLNLTGSLLSDEEPRGIHVQQAMLAYLLYLKGDYPNAFRACHLLVDNPGPMKWASLLVYITIGWLNLHSGLLDTAREFADIACHAALDMSAGAVGDDLMTLAVTLRDACNQACA